MTKHTPFASRIGRVPSSRCCARLSLGLLFWLSAAVFAQSQGLAPLSDPKDLLERAHVIDDAVLKIDCHADVLIPIEDTRRYAGADGRSEVELPKLRTGRVGAIVLAVAANTGPPTPEGMAEARAIADQKLAFILAIARDHPDEAAIALSADDILQIHRSHRIAILLGYQNAYALGGDLTAIDRYVAKGVRVFALTHAGHNAFADSSRPLDGPVALNHGLSALGRAAITRLNDLGVLIDVSQLSTDALIQAVPLSRSPVIATHSDVRALIDTPRNLTDAEIDLIAQHDGVIGLTPFSEYLSQPSASALEKYRAIRVRFGLSPDFKQLLDGVMGLSDENREKLLNEAAGLRQRATLKDFVDHVDYVVKRVGVDHVAIGSDFNHGAGITSFADAADAGNVTAELVRRGYTQTDIAKIWSGNFLRVLGRAEQLATAKPPVRSPR